MTTEDCYSLSDCGGDLTSMTGLAIFFVMTVETMSGALPAMCAVHAAERPAYGVGLCRSVRMTTFGAMGSACIDRHVMWLHAIQLQGRLGRWASLRNSGSALGWDAWTCRPPVREILCP